MKKHPQSWGRIPRAIPAATARLTDRFAGLRHIEPRDKPLLVYGNGRSYGDVCLNEGGTLLLSRGLDRFISFDRDAGYLRCESGVLLSEILALVVPYGWFLPVTPGTSHVTVGGAIANDVHGKNHHVEGSFGCHVRALELVRSDGERLVCSPEHNREWFAATVGGLGLTGLVTWAELRLKRINNPWMVTETKRFGSLDEFWEINAVYESAWPYTVAWVDCLAGGRRRGRGVFMAGRHAPPGGRPCPERKHNRRIPMTPPFSLVNSVSLRLFNKVYYQLAGRERVVIRHYGGFFYPLDSISEWNRIYGRRGFFQYQCVLPAEVQRDGMTELLRRIARSGQGSFLAVLKTFGEHEPPGMLSFCRPGATLALDFPNRGKATLRLFGELDAVVREAGGALYPAKDARMSPDMFEIGYSRLDEFSKYVDQGFSSSFWRRMCKG